MEPGTYFVLQTLIMELLYGLLCTAAGFLIVIPLLSKTRRMRDEQRMENEAIVTRIARLESESETVQLPAQKTPELEVEATVT